MKHRILFILLLATAALRLGVAAERGFVSVQGPKIVAPGGAPLLLRGINLGNWLVPEGYMFKFQDASSPRLINEVISELLGPDGARDFWTTYRANYVTRGDIQRIKSLGLNSVRVPFNYRLFTSEGLPETWIGPGFAMLDSVVGWCRESSLWVILDMHCAPGGQTGDNIDDSWGYPWLFESAASQELTAEVWRRIAARYADDPTVLGYDLLNEPIATFEGFAALNPRLEPLYKNVVRAIREVDTNHIVILGGAQWDTNFDVFGAPFDAKSVYTFHRYWMDVEQAMVQPYVDFRTKHSIPIWMGESGENKDEWIDNFRRLMEQNDVGWCFWPYKKMAASTCLVTFSMPEEYDAVKKFADAKRRTFEQVRDARPGIAVVRKALEGFLKNCRSENCRVNEGYARALGLNQGAN